MIEELLQLDGVSLHPEVYVAHDHAKGFHFRARRHIPAHSTIVRCPASLSLSVLDAPEEDWSQHLAATESPEVVTRFFIIEQYMKRKSRWQGYLKTLVQPENAHELKTPSYWDEKSLSMIKGTNLEATRTHRLQTWEEEYKRGISLLKSAGRAQDETFKLSHYIWAATILTSRSFTQEYIRHAKTSHTLSEDTNHFQLTQGWYGQDPLLAFPVLLPVVDIANHDPKVKVCWLQEEGFYGFSLESDVQAEQEICINYGSKGNGELIMGYGFTIPNNVDDVLEIAVSTKDSRNPDGPSGLVAKPKLFSLRLPPEDKNHYLRTVLSEALGVRQKGVVTQLSGTSVIAVVRLIEHLQQKLDVLEESRPLQVDEAGTTQEDAHRYYQAQVQILTDNLHLFSATVAASPKLTLDDILTNLPPNINKEFRFALHALLGTRSAGKIRKKGEEHSVFVLWFCTLWASMDGDKNVASSTANEDELESPGRSTNTLSSWLAFIKATFPTPSKISEHTGEGVNNTAVDALHQCIVEFAAQYEDTVYSDEQTWTRDYLQWGWEVIANESAVYDPSDSAELVLFLQRLPDC